MPKQSVLADVIHSATAAKIHFEVWWAQAHTRTPKQLAKMNSHSDFFNASYDAHYTAYHIYLGHLFDTSKSSASISTYLKEIRAQTASTDHNALENEYKALLCRAKTLITARHKTVAHIDQFLTDKEVFSQASAITYDQVGLLITDAAEFVAKLAGHSNSPTLIGIPRDRRLHDATLAMIDALK